MKPKLNFKKFFWVVIVPISVVASLIYVSRPAVSKVIISTVRVGDIVVEVSESGFTRFRTVNTVLASQNGWLSQIHVASGQRVEKDVTPLATITAAQAPLMDPRTRASLKAQVEAASAQEKQASAQVKRLQGILQSTTSELKRAESVLVGGGVSVQEVELLRARVSEIRSEIVSAQATVDSIKHSREATLAALQSAATVRGAESIIVKAPHSGLLSWIHEEKPKFVAVGIPLFDIAVPGDLYFEVDLLARESLAVKPGQEVRFSEFNSQGKVRAMSPTALPKVSPLGVSEQRVRVWVDFKGNVPKEWPAGLELEAHIQTESKNKTLLVPLTAVWNEGDKDFVYKVDGDILTKKLIQSGLKSLNDVEILAGLSEGERVVRFPTEDLKEGQKISAGI